MLPVVNRINEQVSWIQTKCQTFANLSAELMGKQLVANDFLGLKTDTDRDDAFKQLSTEVTRTDEWIRQANAALQSAR